MKTRYVLTLFLGILTLAWGVDAFVLHPVAGDPAWVMRKQLIYLTGVWAMGLMSLTMILSTRPVWLESALGGMDRVYRLHKWSGILAISLGIAHWLIKLGKGVLASIAGPVINKPHFILPEIMDPYHGLAKDAGEWMIYILIASLVITLWKAFPYKSWRILHRIMPLLYLALVFHTVVLTPAAWWLQPVGLIMGVLMLGGSLACIPALAQRIGHRRQHVGTIESVNTLDGGITEVSCTMDASWPGHQAGQFAFVSFDPHEGAHPFTIASASNGRTLGFEIKALGDYTRTLSKKLHTGQRVRIEGPYGRFNLDRGQARQAWVAGGIGVTPFLSWLESLQANPQACPEVQLHYCVRDTATDPFVERLRTLCATLPHVTLNIHDASKGDLLTAQAVRDASQLHEGDPADIWFCGPVGLAKHLESGLQALGLKDIPVHREAFEMR